MTRVVVNQEFPPDQLAVRIQPPEGQPARWAEDEPKAENVLSGIRKSGQMPGGHKELTGTLYRDPRQDWPDLVPYSDIVLEQPGGNKVWEGRLDKAPEVDGQRMAIEPAAVGHANALSDRRGILCGFIDADMGKWGDPSAAMRLEWKGKNFFPSGTHPDSVTPAVFLAVTEPWGSGSRSAAVYSGGGVPIGGVYYSREKTQGVGTFNWAIRILVENNLALTVESNSGTIETAKTNSFVEAPSAFGRYVEIELFNDEAKTGTSTETADKWSELRVIGTQGLVLQGSWPEVGFTAKQMLEWAIPEFSYLEANEESIEDDGFIIPHAWFGEPTELQAIVQELTKYGLYDWFVLNGKLFEMRKPGTYGRKWQASVGPSELQEAGIDGSRLWRTIVVRWTDVDGTTKSVGPPGSGATLESANLEITDPNHPAVQAGIAREDVLDLQGISEEKFALQVGERWLKEANELSRSGEATLKGYVMDDKAVFRPVAQIMPGDQIRFPDAGSSGIDYRRIVQVDYTHDSRECKVTLEAPKETYEALLERYRAKLSAAGLGA